MDQLTNLYKHKCEQLQEQINNIKIMLNEMNIDTTSANLSVANTKEVPVQAALDTNNSISSTRTNSTSNYGNLFKASKADGQSFTDWLRNNPPPDPTDPRYDTDGDGTIDADEMDQFTQAWEVWERQFRLYLLEDLQRRLREWTPSGRAGDDSIWIDDMTREVRNVQGKPRPGDSGPNFSREDYDLWYYLCVTLHHMDPTLFDYLWRFARHGIPGFPGIERPDIEGPDPELPLNFPEHEITN